MRGQGTGFGSKLTIVGEASDESGVSEVSVFGQAARLEASGRFSAEVRLKVGANRIPVTATDVYGNRAEETFTFKREEAAVAATNDNAAPPPIVAGRHYALLIGVEQYQDKRIAKLDHPLNDTQRLRKVLTERYAFDDNAVRVLANPTRAEIFKGFKELRDKLTPQDLLLVFYAGHGEFDKGNDEGYWLPSDAESNLSTQWFSNSDLCNQIKPMQARHILLITDSCFSGSLVFKARELFSNASAAIQESYAMPSRKAITSGALKTVPDKSVFIDYLVKRLEENKEDYLTALRLFAAIGEAVTNNSPNRQKPLYGPIQGVGDEGGDFVFVRRR